MTAERASSLSQWTFYMLSDCRASWGIMRALCKSHKPGCVQKMRSRMFDADFVCER